MKKITFTILFTSICFYIQSQQIPDISKLHADKNLIMNVKQYGQFVKRFNYEEDFSGKLINAEFKKRINRANYIALLFNNKDPKLKDTSYLTLMGEFIQTVVNDSLKIKRLSENTFAFAKCQIAYKKDPMVLFLSMNFEKKYQGYRWALFDAYSEFLPAFKNPLDTLKTNPDKLKFIPPTSNEVNFSHLRIIFEDYRNLSPYISQFNRGKRINALIDIAETGDIKFNYVEKLKYYIFDIPGWIIEVSEFIRNNENSGWLISNIWKSNEKTRNYMLNEIERLTKL